MQKKITNLAAIFLLVISLGMMVNGCSKTGPEGATGPQGTQGPQGPQGVQGPQGNANVFTDTFTIRNRDWLMSSDYWYTVNSSISIGYQTRYHDQQISELTNGILDSGMVLTFFRSSVLDSFQWSPLPFSFIAQGQQYFYNFAYETMLNKVRFHYFYSENIVGPTLPNIAADSIATHLFKIVLIAGQLVTGMKHCGINTSDYGQVMDYLEKQ